MRTRIKKLLLSTALLSSALPFLAISCAKKDQEKNDIGQYRKIINNSKIANNYKEELNQLLNKYEKEKLDKNQNSEATWAQIKKVIYQAIHTLYQNKYTSMIPVFLNIETFMSDKSSEGLASLRKETINKLQSNPFIDLRDRAKDLSHLANKYLQALEEYLKNNKFVAQKVNSPKQDGYVFTNEERAFYFKELSKDSENNLIFSFNDEIKASININILETFSKDYLKTEIELLKAKNKPITNHIINDYKDVRRAKTYTLISSNKILEDLEIVNDDTKTKLSELIDSSVLEDNVLLIKEFSYLKLQNLSKEELFYYYSTPFSIENNKFKIAKALMAVNNPFLEIDQNFEKISNKLFRLYYLIPKSELPEVNNFLDKINKIEETSDYKWFLSNYWQILNNDYLESKAKNQVINNLSSILSSFEDIDTNLLPRAKQAINELIINGLLLGDNPVSKTLKKFGPFTSLLGDLIVKKIDEFFKEKVDKNAFILNDVEQMAKDIASEILKLSNEEIKTNKLKLFTLSVNNKIINVLKYNDNFQTIPDSKLAEEDGKFILSLDEEEQAKLEFSEKTNISEDSNIQSALSLELNDNKIQTIEKDLTASEMYSNAILYNDFQTIDDEGEIESSNSNISNNESSSNANSAKLSSTNLSSLYDSEFFKNKSLAYLSHIKVKYIVYERNQDSMKLIPIYELPFKYSEQSQNFEKQTSYIIGKNPILTINPNVKEIPNELGLYLSINKDAVEKLKDFLSKNSW